MKHFLCVLFGVSAMILTASFAHGEMLEDEIAQTPITWTSDGEGGWQKRFVIDGFVLTDAIAFYKNEDRNATYIVKHRCSGVPGTFEFITWEHGDTEATKIDCNGTEGKVHTASILEKIIGAPPENQNYTP